MEVQLTILGSNSALPAQGRHPSAQVLHIDNELILIDCGEGTQLQMSNFNIRRSKISTIFISHLHGDHIYGLPGLITSYNHHGRKGPLTIYGPLGLKKFIDYSVFITGNPLNFDMVIHEFDADEKQVLVDTDKMKVTTQPLHHRIPTSGFLFEWKNPALRIKPGIFDEYDVEIVSRGAIQKGADWTDPQGNVLLNEVFTMPSLPPIRYAYFSDTAYAPELVEAVRKYDALYHEATFLSNLKQKAIDTKHSTAEEAATFAKAAGVGQLIIGHFSSRYSDLGPLLEEAKEIFSESHLAIEGQTFFIGKN